MGQTTAWADPGCTNPLACNFDPTATSDDGSCDYVSCLVFGCTNPSACNFDPNADYSDGSCEYVTCAGCTNPSACDYDPDATLAAPCYDFTSCYGCTDPTAPNYDPDVTFDNGSCEVPGCTIVGACNFDPDANVDDGTCDFYSCLPSGCLNQNACNYDPSAIISDGSCYFAESGYDCDGNCLADTDGDGICDANEIEGCTDSTALNYDADATDDDGSCIASVPGCQDPTACNYNPAANVNDDSCEFTSCAGCLSSSACNYDPTAIYPAACEFPDAGYNCAGECLLDSDGDGVCNPFEIAGCTDPEACNYDENATELDGSCDYSSCQGCTNPYGCNYDPNATVDDGSCDYFSCITFGCTNAAACNYDPDATYSDGSCEYVSCAGCTNPLACDYDPTATISAQCTDFTSCVGCTDPLADNYDENATQDNGNCLYIGCTISAACNFDPTANSDDGSCEYESCAGCLNPVACNYDPEAVLSGSCTFAENGYDCDGNCLADADGDGICDPFEVLGCTDPAAVNYDADATDDDGSCFILTEGCIDPSACNYDESANTDDGSCEFTSCAGCLNASACNYDPTAIYPGTCEFPDYGYNCDGSCIADNDGDGICNPFEVPGCTAADACNYDPEATDDDGSCDFISCNVPGCTNPYACNYDPEAVVNDGSCDFLSCLAFGCTNPAACNYDPDATYNDGSCEYTTCAGCTNPLACDYDPDATIAAGCTDYSSCYGCTDESAANYDADATVDNGSCQFPGCTVEGACNYDANANYNDGSCDFFSCLVTGCLNESACNYNPDAQLAGECIYPDAGYDCDGNCLVDTDGDGVCDPFEVSGCTDPSALNFDADATEDNGSCILPVEGCTDSGACNYDVNANVDDGSCEFTSCVGCLSPAACNYDENAVYPGECEFPESGYDCDGNCLSDFDGDGVCDPFEVLGCDDPNSINYDPNATQDDGSCIPIVEGCTNADACNFNADANVDDGSCDFESCVGCLSPTACNYDPNATVAGECVFPDLGYGCDGECLVDTDGDGVCDLFEVAGCTEPGACNYDPEATDDNGSCFTALDGYDCEGNCLSDQDGDGICDPFELAPILTIPADTLAECGSDLPAATATGGCSEPLITFSDEVIPGNCDGNYTVIRSWTASDNCGNSVTKDQIILLQDTTAPALVAPADYTVECSDDIVMDAASATDACSSFDISETSVTTPGDAAGNYTIVRTFTATDDCGNSSSATQTITAQDTTAPEFTFVPADYTVECSDEMPMDDATASDNCGEVTIEVTSATTAGDAAGNYTITRTFTATDDAGNSSSATQTITVQDTTGPEFVFTPADALVECTDAWPSEVPEVLDACGSFDLELNTDTVPGLCGDLVVVTRTYVATDDAGNASTFTQTLTQIDTQGPIIDLVEEVDLSCSQNLNAVPVATATDLCSEVTNLIWTDVEYSGGCTLPISALLRTYTAIDACGNVSQAEQVINLLDSEAPTWSFLPEDVTIECSEFYELEPAVATDNCAEPEVTWTVDTVGVVSTGMYDLVFDFVAMDNCDNIAEHQHVVHVTDTTAPEWTTFPEDHTMACDGELDDSMPTATDACSDSVTVVLVSQVWTPGECDGSGQWVRTFAATDWNGNMLVSSQTILVVDQTPPSFTSIPEDLTLECDVELPNDLPVAVDNCSEVNVTFEDSIELGEGLGNYVVSRTFTATDACGNGTSAVRTFTVQDTTAPEFTFVPADYTVECSDEMPMDEATASDNCGEVSIEVTSETLPGDATGNYVLVRTFTATDDAGNATVEIQTIEVEDTTAPELTLPEDYTVECSSDMLMEDAVALDNCGEVFVTLTTDTVLGNAAGNYQILRTFEATDDAGNSTSGTQTITVVDTTAPTVTLPADTTVACDAAIPVWEPLAEDNCGSTAWESTDEILEGSCAGESTILRHYVVTDDAGNETVGTQTITVVDNVAPEFTFVPESVIWECNAPTEIDSALAVDNCSALTLTAQLDTLDALVANQWILLVTWTAEDACGNAAQATQEIQVLDQLPPTIDVGPADATLPWGEELLLEAWEAELVYSDSCSDSSDLAVSVTIDTLEATVACVDEVILTWTVTDLAGNEAMWMQHVNLMDNDAPVWAYEPEDITLGCDEVWNPVFPEGIDHNVFTDTVVVDTLFGDCANHYTHVWTLTAEDVCGNVTEPWVLNVTYVDTVAPTILTWPEDLLLNNASEVPECESGLVTWTDICSSATDSCFTDTVEVYCPGSFLLARTYVVTDECGNAASVQQSILVEDVEPPTWLNFPDSMTVSCDSLVDAISVEDLQVVDNASGEEDILKEWLESVESGDNCIWRETHTYRATDGCGNATELKSYFVEFVDDTPPSLAVPLEQLDLQCVSEIPACEETAVDAVDDCNDWSFSCNDAFEGGGCTGPDCTLIRTITVTDVCGNPADFEQIITVVEPPTVPELPTGFSPNNDSYNDVYQIRNAGPDLGIPPCDWLENTVFTVFDRWGSVVYESEDVSIPWDGTNLNGRPLPVGTYFVVFEANGLTYRETVDLRR